MTSRRGRFERRFRYALMILLVALAAAVVWLWVIKRPDEAKTFARIYQVSVDQASGNFTLEAALGVPIKAPGGHVQYHFYEDDGRQHVRFSFPLQGSHGQALIAGEAVRIGSNWLIVSLAASMPHRGQRVDLSPNVRI
ncbi:MAG: hypothetical protein ACRETC_03430 [Gammaproteobacteria bacterium]